MVSSAVERCLSIRNSLYKLIVVRYIVNNVRTKTKSLRKQNYQTLCTKSNAKHAIKATLEKRNALSNSE